MQIFKSREQARSLVRFLADAFVASKINGELKGETKGTDPHFIIAKEKLGIILGKPVWGKNCVHVYTVSCSNVYCVCSSSFENGYWLMPLAARLAFLAKLLR